MTAGINFQKQVFLDPDTTLSLSPAAKADMDKNLSVVGEEYMKNVNGRGVDVYQLAENFVHKEHNCMAAILDFNKRAFGWDFHKPEPVRVPKDNNAAEDTGGWVEKKKKIVKTEDW